MEERLDDPVIPEGLEVQETLYDEQRGLLFKGYFAAWEGSRLNIITDSFPTKSRSFLQAREATVEKSGLCG